MNILKFLNCLGYGAHMYSCYFPLLVAIFEKIEVFGFDFIKSSQKMLRTAGIRKKTCIINRGIFKIIYCFRNDRTNVTSGIIVIF